jgi:uncharacterized protein YndB with AHSA1/START domain
MERKTKVTAENGKQEIIITREFDLPLDLLFKAYEDPECIEEWMGSKAVKLENKKHGSWRLEKKDANGNILFQANGTIHEFIPNKTIIRTFEMDGTGFGVQLEFLDFEKLSDETSKLTMHIIYRSVAQRDQYVQIGMTGGVNMAHNALQKAMSKRK